MKSLLKILLGLFVFAVSINNINAQDELILDTTYATICNNEYYSDENFDSISVEDTIGGYYAMYGAVVKIVCTIMPDGTDIDTMYYLFISFNSSYNDTINAIICDGEVYSQFGFNENQTGFYTQRHQTVLGCDSIINLNLIVGQNYNDTIFASICNGETYSMYGFSETQTGVYTHYFQSMYGCDSIITLSLVVNDPYFDTIYDTICQGDIYEYGFNADSSGTYVQYLKTQFGCDSILTLHLWVNPSYYDTIKAEIYKGNVYTLYGFRESVTGIYEQKHQTYLGCDSIIYLDLQVDNVMFPNVVTPNGDGINDVFDIHNLIEQNAFPENELIIYSRQGKLIYNVKNISKESDLWDPNKTSSPEGTYFYRFLGKRSDKTLEYVGSVEVLR